METQRKLSFLAKKIVISKVKEQLLLAFILVTIVPIFIVGTFSILNARKQMKKHYESQIEAETTRINSTLFDITTSMYTTCEPLVTKNVYRKLLATTQFNDSDKTYYNSLSSFIKAIRETSAAVSSIKVYTNNPHLPTSEFIFSVDKDFTDQQWHQTLDKAVWNNWSCTTSKNSLKQNIYELTLTRKINVTSDDYSAYLVVTISSNYLRNRLLYTDSFILASIDGTPTFFASDFNYVHRSLPFPNDFKGNYYKYIGPMMIKNKKSLTNIATFAPYKTQDKFYILVSNSDAYTEMNKITFIYGMILLISVLLPTLIIISFSSYFSARIITLRQAMHQASLGDYNIINSFDGDDELAQTFFDLKTTVKLIHEKERKLYQEQITQQKLVNKQQQMEFKMLASQINPHFLYNTLETIRMQALSNNNLDVASSIKLLGKSMHYVLENTGTNSTTLYKELEHVKVYLAIQQLRFGDRVNYSINIDSHIDLNNYRILPLLLQPIVENAVIHGLEGILENGYINISIALSDPNCISIKVKDNGDGMDEKMLQLLNQKMDSKNIDCSSSIGLYNINQRIKLLYGEQYQLKITSKIHEGTTVTLVLPQQYIDE